MRAPRFTKAEYDAIMAKASPVTKVVEMGHRGMNKWELAYAGILECERMTGEIKAWRFEAIKLRLAASAYYKPDFLVINNDNIVEIREVKGHYRKDSKVKMKIVTELFPWFKFYLITKENGAWKKTEVQP